MKQEQYLTLLRGINVSGQKIIKMAELRSQLENSGLKDVKTYIQSGNIIFKNEELSLEKINLKMNSLLKDIYGWDIPCISLTINMLQELINENPFPGLAEQTKNMPYVCIPQRALTDSDFKNLAQLEFDGEHFIATKNAIYLYNKVPSHKSKMSNNVFEKALEISCTTRNWRTLNKLISLMG